MRERGFWGCWDGARRVVRSALRHVPMLVVLTHEERRAWRGMWRQESVRELVRTLPLGQRIALERANARLASGVAVVLESKRRIWLRLLFGGKIGDAAGSWLNDNFPRHETCSAAAVNVSLTRKLRTGSVSALRFWEWLEQWPQEFSARRRRRRAVVTGGV